MSRINIEDSVWRDPRFMNLCVRMGDELRAMGALVLAFRTAQDFWFPNKMPIPERSFNDRRLPLALVECGLVRQENDGFYVCGSEEQFSWLFQRSAAGKASGITRKKAKTNGRSTVDERLSTSDERDRTSFSFSSSSSTSNSSSPSGSAPPTPPPDGGGKKNTTHAAEKSAGVREFIGAYCDAIKARYGFHPSIGGKEAGVAKRLVANLGSEAAVALLDPYLRYPDRMVQDSKHPLNLLELKLQAVQVFSRTGEGPGVRNFAQEREDNLKQLLLKRERSGVYET